MTEKRRNESRGFAADDLIEVARIIKTVGLRGELKVASLTRKPEGLRNYEHFLIACEEQGINELHVERLSLRSGSITIKFSGIDHIDVAQPLVNRVLFVRRDQLKPPEESEYFISDLIGIEVYSSEGQRLGVLKDVLELPAHDVYQVMDGNRELLIPAVKDFIKDVDLEKRRMTVKSAEGL